VKDITAGLGDATLLSIENNTQTFVMNRKISSTKRPFFDLHHIGVKAFNV
jgi:hypothetical protein